MYPSLGTLFGEPVSSYFVLLLVGFAAATAIVSVWGKRLGMPQSALIDCGLISVIGGVLGGRLLHVLADGYFWDYVHLCSDPAQVGWRVTEAQCGALAGAWDAAQHVCHPRTRDCWAWAKFYNGGLAYYGGLLGGGWAVLWLARRDGLPRRLLCDVVSVGVAVGLVLGRLGCWLAGCCYGVATTSRWGVRFPAWSPASEGQFRAGRLASPAVPSLPVHPTQLYEAAGCLLIAIALALWFPRRRFAGQLALLALLAYATLRFLLELVRDDDRGAALGLSTSQWIGVAITLASLLLWRRWSGSEREPGPGTAAPTLP